jgi:hypothetical protein
MDPLGGFLKGRDGGLGPAALGQGIAALTGKFPHVAGQVAGFGEWHERRRSKSDVAPPALDDSAQRPPF